MIPQVQIMKQLCVDYSTKNHYTLPSVSHLRMDGFAREVTARCIFSTGSHCALYFFSRHFWVVFRGVAQHVTLSVTTRPLILLPDVVVRQVRSLRLIPLGHFSTNGLCADGGQEHYTLLKNSTQQRSEPKWLYMATHTSHIYIII